MRDFILGTDWWDDCDDAVALRVLSRHVKDNKIRLLGIGINACMEYSAASLSGFLRAEGLCGIPVGIDTAATDFGGEPSYQKRLAEDWGEGAENGDFPDAVRLYRRLLAASDGPVEIIEIGFLQVIANVLESGADDISPKSGMELVREKVSRIWVMAGRWDEDGGRENNFCRNARSCAGAAKFCELCPVPVTFLGWEVGCSVITGNRLDREDHLYRVLADHGSGSGRWSWDPMLAMLAMIGDEEAAGYKAVVGKASVEPGTGENHFTPDPAGSHRFVVKVREDETYAEQINGIL